MADDESENLDLAPSVEIQDLATNIFVKSLPKLELHAHLNGSISPSTIRKLIEYKKQRTANGFDVPKDWECCMTGEKRMTLEQGFMIFKIVHTLVDDHQSLAMVTRDVITEFFEDGVHYLELRSTPRANELNKITKRSYVETILQTIIETTRNMDIIVRFLLSIDRRQSVGEAEDTVKLATEFKDKYNGLVVGVDLSGDPKIGDAAEFLPCLKQARLAGLKLTFHVAEVPNIAETKTLLMFRPDRIGHGTCIYPDKGGDEELVASVLQAKIPLELCLTSNVKCRTVKSYEDHHFKDWRKNGHPIVICTDDKGVFTSSLSEEYLLAAKTFNLSKAHLWKLSYDSIDYIFEQNTIKEQLWTKWQRWKKENL
ncbi:adenosine deaminase-like protein [Dendronephthya gigantea]|uniref:adenosine deaminase-like protein n=1 Tax=Dendronephthya gigantea TaxID=151771 RepID=UPI00106D7CF9|nr:adenosine deaminase-like protein [Dendronephthya gigantea]